MTEAAAELLRALRTAPRRPDHHPHPRAARPGAAARAAAALRDRRATAATCSSTACPTATGRPQVDGRGWPGAPRWPRSRPTCRRHRRPLRARRCARRATCSSTPSSTAPRCPTAGSTTLAAWCAPRGWAVSLQGRKVYAVPRPLTKSAAAAEVRAPARRRPAARGGRLAARRRPARRRRRRDPPRPRRAGRQRGSPETTWPSPPPPACGQAKMLAGVDCTRPRRSGSCDNKEDGRHHGAVGPAEEPHRRSARQHEDAGRQVQEQGLREGQHGHVRADRRRGRHDHAPRSGARPRRSSAATTRCRCSSRASCSTTSTSTRRSWRRDYDFGKVEAIATIGKLKGKPDAARAVIQVGIIIGGADGNFDNDEKQAVREACNAVGISPGGVRPLTAGRARRRGL